MRIENVVMFQVKDKLAWNEHAHFHPSSDPSPSNEDILLTKQLVECGKIIGIEVLDHIIVGADGGGYVSLKEQDKMWFIDWDTIIKKIDGLIPSIFYLGLPVPNKDLYKIY